MLKFAGVFAIGWFGTMFGFDSRQDNCLSMTNKTMINAAVTKIKISGTDACNVFVTIKLKFMQTLINYQDGR